MLLQNGSWPTHRAVVMHRGRVALTGTPAELVELPEVHNAYLGGAAV